MIVPPGVEYWFLALGIIPIAFSLAVLRSPARELAAVV
jgi:hypothetical protein